MCGNHVTANARNLLAAMRFFGSARRSGEIRDLPGVCLVSCGLDYAAFNAALLSEPVGMDHNEMRQRIQTPASHFQSRNLRWTYWLCDDFLSKDVRRGSRALFRTFGLSLLTEPPGLYAERLQPARRRMPELAIRRVEDEKTRRAFAHVTAIAFEIPQSICAAIYGSASAWSGDFHGFVGFVDGLPVATTATIVAAGVVGVYSVGTLPAFRKRGYGEAMMRHALAAAKDSTGIEQTVLQTTQSGQSLYQKMGYRNVTKFTVYIS